MDNGWLKYPETNTPWTNFSQCFSGEFATVVMELPVINASLIEVIFALYS